MSSGDGKVGMECVVKFLTTDDEVNLRTEGEEIARSVYSSEALDNYAGSQLNAFLDAFIDKKSSWVAMERAFHILVVIGTKYKRFRVRFLEIVGSRKVLDVITLHKANERVQRKAMFFLNVLSLDEACRRMLVEANSGQTLVEVLEAQKHSQDVNERACTALSNLALGNHDMKVALGREGCIRALAQVVTLSQSRSSIVLASLLSIRNLTHECEENVAICRQEEVGDVVLKASVRFQSQLQIQSQVVIILTNIIKQDTELRQKMGRTKADLNIIVGLLKLSADSRALAKHSLELMRIVVERNDEAVEYFGEQEIIGVIRDRVEAFHDQPEIVEHSCAVLRFLGFHSKPREQMRDAQIFPCIVDGLKEHRANCAVVQQCVCAISNACVLNTENQDALGMQGAVEATIQAMEMHRENYELQDFGCRALRNLADNSEFNIRLEGDCGGINAATLALLGFPDNGVLAEQACAALLNMARSEQNAIRMLEQDVQDVVCQCLAKTDAEGFKKQAKRLITVLERPLNSEAGAIKSESSFISRTFTGGNGPQSTKSGQVGARQISRRMSRMRTKSAMTRTNTGPSKSVEEDGNSTTRSQSNKMSGLRFMTRRLTTQS